MRSLTVEDTSFRVRSGTTVVSYRRRSLLAASLNSDAKQPSPTFGGKSTVAYRPSGLSSIDGRLGRYITEKFKLTRAEYDV
jgi:hypothetical protein